MEGPTSMTTDCEKNKTAYDCLKNDCEYAEAADGQFICHKPTIKQKGYDCYVAVSEDQALKWVKRIKKTVKK